ncbi:MAG TPA: long-chain fatty acid--CoA ligase, partial [Deltaproteobacteria bacterium]|nr:long-chain fatty acid--CoA ligase [Deltaproteobacteria bacterium]
MTSSSIPLIARASEHGDTLALLAPEGEFSYRRLLEASGRAASGLLKNKNDLDGERVAYLVP